MRFRIHRLNHLLYWYLSAVAIFKDEARHLDEWLAFGASDRRSYSRYHDRNEVEDPILASKAERVREIIDRVRETDPLKIEVSG